MCGSIKVKASIIKMKDSNPQKPLAVEHNRKATKYTRKELLLRVIWGLGKLVFRLSPRPCFRFRSGLLRLYGAKVGKSVHIYPSALIYYPWNLEIGDWTAIGEWTLIYNLGKVKIGRQSTVSHRAHICAGTHDYTNPTLPLLKPSIEIGDQVWICAEVFVGPGVKIGDGSVVGASAVVTRKVESWSVVAGNPVRKIKERVICQ